MTNQTNRIENLALQAIQGDPDSFGILIQSEMQNLYKTARAILSNDQDAADAISETILTCWEKRAQLREPKYFRTWMTRILINKCRDYIRKQKFLCSDQIEFEKEINDAELENAEWRSVLECLDEKYRLPMLLYYVEKYRILEISEILETPEATVRTYLARGRKQLSHEYLAPNPRKGGNSKHEKHSLFSKRKKHLDASSPIGNGNT